MWKTLPHTKNTLMDRWGNDLQAEQRTDADTTQMPVYSLRTKTAVCLQNFHSQQTVPSSLLLTYAMKNQSVVRDLKSAVHCSSHTTGSSKKMDGI